MIAGKAGVHLLPPALSKLARSYESLLFESDLRVRVAHHLGHVAPETWLAMELAMLVNTKDEEVGMPGWSALVERKRVDVTLIPPGAETVGGLPAEAVFLELKLVATDWWNTAWREVRRDLSGGVAGKPRASYAVCFLINTLSPQVSARRSDTRDRYANFIERVPGVPGPFEPIEGEPKLHLVHTSPVYRVEWPRPIPGRWSNGYSADVRVLWIQA